MDTQKKNQHLVAQIKENVSSVIVGKEDILSMILTSIVAGGHVLLEDVPGTGKTVLAKTLARSIEAEFSRIQFTPDLLPSDVVGLNFYNQKAGDFVLKKGPVFGNIILADEINRATPRTQSSLLECMEERQVTIDGQTQKLAAPFIVIATQNPVETAGTFPLPEAQLDRFLMKLSMGLPDKEEEVAIMERFLADTYMTDRTKELAPVCGCADLVAMQQEAAGVYVHRLIMEYISEIIVATRNHPAVRLGVSPRGTLAMLRAAKAHAYVCGRDYVVPEDIKELAVPVFAHRLVITSGFSAEAEKINIVKEILSKISVPTEEWQK